MSLRATGLRLLVLPDRPPTRTRSGLLLPRASQHPASTGRLVSAGPAALRRFSGLCAGQRVAFRPFAGRVLEHEGRSFRLLEWHEMYGILVDDTPPPVVDAPPAGQ